MVDVRNNCYIVNAPAGSGKTTYIKSMVAACLANNPQDNTLCITYTKRAAEELKSGLKSTKITVGTIHSFLADYLKQYFKLPAVIKKYCSLFEVRIKERIENVDNKESITESNKKYEERYGSVSFDTICANLSEISYNETQYSALFYGRLSHDDLILFASELFSAFPAISMRLATKYQHIFIDEYQDTSANVLRIFYNSVKGSTTELFLFGDRMQQIYRNYDGSFEHEFSEFDVSLSLNTNHRSTNEIIKILNKIYNDKRYEQRPDEENPVIGHVYSPRLIISSNISSSLEAAQKEAQDTLTLFLLNKERFETIGALNLYNAYSKMSRYDHTSQYSAVDVLTTAPEDNPDSLMRLLFLLFEMLRCFESCKYGSIIQKANQNKGIFNRDSWRLVKHQDKANLRTKLETIFKAISDKVSIDDFLTIIEGTMLLNSEYYERISLDEEYQQVKGVQISEVEAIANYLASPTVSTQHGVKGESHETVVFLADDNKGNPLVHMYRFFDLWSNVDISLDGFQTFCYAYIKRLRELEASLGCKVSDVNKSVMQANSQMLIDIAQKMCSDFDGNEYFQQLCENAYKEFLTKQTVKNVKAAFDDKCVLGVLMAYRLFYVGCSRARRNLTILLDRSKMQGEIEKQIEKFKWLGFSVEVS